MIEVLRRRILGWQYKLVCLGLFVLTTGCTPTLRNNDKFDQICKITKNQNVIIKLEKIYKGIIEKNYGDIDHVSYYLSFYVCDNYWVIVNRVPEGSFGHAHYVYLNRSNFIFEFEEYR